MKVSYKERRALIIMITDTSSYLSKSKIVPVKKVAKLAVYSSILEKHQNHIADVKIVHKGLKDFIDEVRANETSCS